VVSTWTDLLFAINLVVGAEKASDVVLASFVTFLLVVCIYYSIRLSDLAEQNKKIAQEMAVIKISASRPSDSSPPNKTEDGD